MSVSPWVAKLNGLPGFMNSRRKWTSASSEKWLYQIEVSHRDAAAGENDVALLEAVFESPSELIASSGPRPDQITSAPASEQPRSG